MQSIVTLEPYAYGAYVRGEFDIGDRYQAHKPWSTQAEIAAGKAVCSTDREHLNHSKYDLTVHNHYIEMYEHDHDQNYDHRDSVVLG